MTKSKYYWVRMVYFQVQNKKLKLRMKKVSCNLVLSIAVWLLLILLICCLIPLSRLEVANQQKINKRKKPITFPFEAQIVIHFFLVFKGHYKLNLDGVFREERVHLVLPIVNLGFLYPKLSKVFYQQYSLKNLKI